MKYSIPKLAELYETGFSLNEISKLTDIPSTTVRGRLLAAGIEMRPRGAALGNSNRWGTPQDVFILTAFLYEHLGWSQKEIGEYLGVNKSTVRDRLIVHGVVMRSRSEAIRLRFARRGFNRDNSYLSKRKVKE